MPPEPPPDSTTDAIAELAGPACGIGPPDGALHIDGVSARELCERFGTPLYAFSAATLRRRTEQVRAALGDRVELLWSVKANPSVAVTRVLREAGCGAEIASAGELQVALAAGHDAASLRFAGPGKTDAELAEALAIGLGTFHVESLDELRSLQRLAEHADTTANVAIRVNLPQQLKGSRMRMGGAESRFGVDAEQVPELVREVMAHQHLELRGLHVYGGTQCFDALAFVAHAEDLLERAAVWQRELAVRFDEIDLGGGFGVAVFDGDPAFDLEAAGRALQPLLQQHDQPGRRWFVELGRFLAAPAGVFLTRVVRTKTSGGITQLALDGGMHQAAAQAGFGTIVRRPPLLVAAERPFAEAVMQATCGGPLCTPADRFGTQLALPQLATGDLLALLHAGAYGLTYSPHGFLSHATPAEVLIDGGAATIVRQRGAPSDALRAQQY